MKKKNAPGGCNCCGPDPCVDQTATGLRVTISGFSDCSDALPTTNGDFNCDRDLSQFNGSYDFSVADVDPTSGTAADRRLHYFEEIFDASGCSWKDGDPEPPFWNGNCKHQHYLAICVEFRCLTSEPDTGMQIAVRVLTATIEPATSSATQESNCDSLSFSSPASAGSNMVVWRENAPGTSDPDHDSSFTSVSFTRDAGTGWTEEVQYDNGDARCCDDTPGFPQATISLTSDTHTVDLVLLYT